MNPDDRRRIGHMIEAGELAVAFVAERSRADLTSDPMLRLALVKAIEILGEAASKVSVAARQDLPAIPWAVIIGMRHHLVHGYMAIDEDILWTTVEERLPELLAQLRGIAGPSTS